MHPALLLIGNGNDEAVGLSALIASATLLHHRNLPRLRGGNAIEAFAAGIGPPALPNGLKTELSGRRDNFIRKQITEFTDISIRARGPRRVGCDNHCQLKRRHDVDQLTAIAACIKELSPSGA